MTKFTADLRKFRELTEKKMGKILRQSVQDVVNDAQTTVNEGGNMPVDTSFLRNSLATERNGAKLASAKGNVTLAILQLEPGDAFRVGWTAEYARRLNYGFVGDDSLGRTYNQSGYYYRDKAAAKWQSFVDANARKVARR